MTLSPLKFKLLFKLVACALFFVSPISAIAFDFEKSLQTLAAYEKEIRTVHDNATEQTLRNNIVKIQETVRVYRQELQREIDSSTSLLTALASQQTNEQGDAIDPEETSDRVLLRNQSALEKKLAGLNADIRKSRLIDVYARELLAKIRSKQQKQLKEILTTQTPPLYDLTSWQGMAQEFSAFWSANSNELLKLSLLGSFMGSLLIFFFGPKIYRWYAKSTKRNAEESGFPTAHLMGIFLLLMLSNLIVLQDNLFVDFPLAAYGSIALITTLLSPLLYQSVSRISLQAKEIHVDGETETEQPTSLLALRALCKLVIAASAIAAIIGYGVLGIYTLFNIALTLAALYSFAFLRQFGEQAVRKVSNKEEAGITPIGLISIEVTLIIFLIYTVTRLWGFSLHNFDGATGIFRSDYQVGSIQLDFQHMSAAVITFIVILYISKSVRWFLRERVFPHAKMGIGVPEATQTLVSYVGILFAIVMAMSALGVDWGKLALIAGALSVGIGFGLQTIISNFFSGLILLFERPVRVGDWVILGNGLEGHIRKINIRSTEIQTFERSSVLIPNSNLLSETITNWTLNDPVGRIDVQVGVAYGSDTSKVEEVLLAVAGSVAGLRTHPIPKVLFINFGDSSLDFVLRVYLRNINDRFNIGSELRFGIDSEFRKHGISIPFPQRDLHVISSSEPLLDAEHSQLADDKPS